MYAGSQFTWYDTSTLATATEAVENPNPVVRFMLLITSDKGSEDLTTLYGQDWFDMYGNKPSFKNHGQPLIQAYNIIKAGGVGVTKRLVAEDSTLSNLILVASVEKVTTEKVDADGNPLYIDPTTGNETTDAGADGTNARATSTVAQISHSLMSVEDAKDYDDVLEAAESEDNIEETETKVSYPLFVFADNGRGYTGKKISVIPEYQLSRSGNFMMYTAHVYEESTETDKVTFTANPDIVHLAKSYELSKFSMTQVRCATIKENVTKFVNAIADITGYGADYLLTQDFLFGQTVKGKDLEAVQFDESSIDITTEFGLELQNGDNGSFGDAPFGTQAYIDVAHKYLTGETTDEIYDFTECNVDVMFDANLPDQLKADIEEWADWREDFVFFEDLGLDLTSYEAIYDKVINNSNHIPSRFNGLYSTSYDVYDPITRKPIQVTMLYSLAPLMVNFFGGGRHRPLCGESNNLMITDYIPGTIRYVPRVTPKVNQKTMLEDIRVNYACKYSSDTDALTPETCYTSQEVESQSSFINNVLAIQQVIKAIRNYSPKVRYTFTTGYDFKEYKELIEDNVLVKYTANFTSLQLVYVADEDYAKKKIFKASLVVSCGNFVQTEMYDVFIID